MTFSKALSLRPARRHAMVHARALGVALALACGSPFMAFAADIAPVAAVQPAATVVVTKVDFKRGDDGAGRLILQFDGQGASPDLRTQGNNVVVDVGNAVLPTELQRPLNVVDFATPVQRIDAKPSGKGSQLVLSTQGAFESLAYQTGNEYVVEIAPRQEASATGSVTAKTVAQAAAAVAARGYSGKPVTFNFQDVPVRTVLQLVAEESGLNLVASDTVQGSVTLRLVNVPWDQALDIVLQAKSLDKRRSGNVVWVAPQKEIAQFEQDKEDARINLENRAETVTEYIPVNYASAEDIAKLLTEQSLSSQGAGGGGGGSSGQGGQQDRGFLSPRGSLSYDKRTNTLLAIDIPQRVANIRNLVQQLDKPVDQVVIEARIVIANENVARELGARFGISGAKDNAYFSGNLDANTDNRNADASAARTNAELQKTYTDAINAWIDGGRVGSAPTAPVPVASTITRGLMTNLPAALIGANAGSMALSILNAGYLLDVELSAIQTQGRAEVISNPRIVTSNQKESVIRQGKEIGYLTVSGGQGGNVPTVNFKEALLELKVTPTITNDGRVFLNLNVKKDELDGFVNLGTFGSVPQIAKREVNTAVLVDDGQTVVIGGVYEFTDANSVAKVPFLGNVPFLGAFFKKTSRSKDKAELLIFLTPKVMRVEKRGGMTQAVPQVEMPQARQPRG